MTATRLPLEVRGTLSVATEHGALVLHADGDLIVLDAQSVAALGELRDIVRTYLPPRPSPRPRGAGGSSPADIVALVRDVLAMLDLTVEVRLAGEPVLRLGAAAKPSLLARMFGAGPVELVSAALATRLMGAFK